MSENYRESFTPSEIVDATRQATLKEVGEWLDANWVPSGELGTESRFADRVIKALLQGKMPEVEPAPERYFIEKGYSMSENYPSYRIGDLF